MEKIKLQLDELKICTAACESQLILLLAYTALEIGQTKTLQTQFSSAVFDIKQHGSFWL